ncbi:hypothetical protein DDE82_006151 [Stemphylium lycopersici]|uniref:Uncharacterized protein n=1 Tax=Stemphylium lycopersici TaxID=183478 RepID=A0A364NA20_STELY|nr:hypothetical protein DDE82_006151 [Stemphylium lycopersici]RAR14165.1 hypothetical protein DDE83_002432 [Stemphylium lycopersici]
MVLSQPKLRKHPKKSEPSGIKKERGDLKTADNSRVEQASSSGGNIVDSPQHTETPVRPTGDDSIIQDRLDGTCSPARYSDITHRNFRNYGSNDKTEPSSLSSVRSSGARSNSTTSSGEDAAGVWFKNIIIPDEETTGSGPLRRHQVRPQTGKPLVLPSINASSEGNKMNQPKAIGPRAACVIMPAGPDALPTLRSMIAGYLLSRLPQYESIEFSTHTKGMGHAWLRLRLGQYGQQDMFKWGSQVYAYLRPSPSPSIGPDLKMEVEHANGGGGFNLVEVDWVSDIDTGRVELLPAFREANNRQQLYAVIKYYFLLATECVQDGVEHHFIPINLTFVTHLEAACRALGTQTSPSGDLSENWEYTDEYASPQLPSRNDKHHRQGRLSKLPGVAKVLREASKGSDLEANKENNTEIRERTSPPSRPLTKGSVRLRDFDMRRRSQTVKSRAPESKHIGSKSKWRFHPTVSSDTDSNSSQSSSLFAPQLTGLRPLEESLALGTSSTSSTCDSLQTNEGLNISREKTRKSTHIRPKIARVGRQRSSQDDQDSRFEMRSKSMGSSSTSLNPLKRRRPSSSPEDTASSISLKKQRKTASGRIKKPKRASGDSSEGSIARAPREKRNSDRDISRRLARLEVAFEMFREQQGRRCQCGVLLEDSDVQS